VKRFLKLGVSRRIKRKTFFDENTFAGSHKRVVFNEWYEHKLPRSSTWRYWNRNHKKTLDLETNFTRTLSLAPQSSSTYSKTSMCELTTSPNWILSTVLARLRPELTHDTSTQINIWLRKTTKHGWPQSPWDRTRECTSKMSIQRQNTRKTELRCDQWKRN